MSSYLENAEAVNDAANRPGEALPAIKSDVERRAIEAAQKLDLTPGPKAVDVSASAGLLASGGEHAVIAAFNANYEKNIAARRAETAERDERDAKATAVYDQQNVISKAHQEIVAAQRQIATAQDKIAIAQRRIAELTR